MKANHRLTHPQLHLVYLITAIAFVIGTVASAQSRAARAEALPPLPSPQAIVAELNRLRTDPAAYADRLEARRAWYRGRELRQPGLGAVVMTREGIAALDEAIDTLRTTSPRPALTASAGIARAALDHARDLVRSRIQSHTGSDGSSPDTRLERYGQWLDGCSEAINFARSLTAEDVIVDLIVDDGVPDRSHRRVLLDPAMRRVGVAMIPHPRYGGVCVIDLAGGYTEGRGRR